MHISSFLLIKYFMKSLGCIISVVVLLHAACTNEEDAGVATMEPRDIKEVEVVPLRDVSFMANSRNYRLWQNDAVMGGQVYLKGILNDTVYFISQKDSLAYSLNNLRDIFVLETPRVSIFQLLPDTSMLVLLGRSKMWMKWNLQGDSLMKKFSSQNLTTDSVKKLSSFSLTPFALESDTIIITTEQYFGNSTTPEASLYSSPQIGVLVRTDTSYNMVNKFGVYPQEYKQGYGIPLMHWEKLRKDSFLISHFWSPKAFILDIKDNQVLDSFELAPSYPARDIDDDQKGLPENKKADLRAKTNTTYLGLRKLGDSAFVRAVSFPHEGLLRLNDLLIYNNEFDLIDRIRLPTEYSGIFVHNGRIYGILVKEAAQVIVELKI